MTITKKTTGSMRRVAVLKAVLASGLLVACTEPRTELPPREVTLAGVVRDSLGGPVEGAYVWTRAWSISNPDEGGEWQGAQVTDTGGMFVAPLGSFSGSVLDSIEIHTLAPGCPRRDPIEEIVHLASIEGDIEGTARTTVIVPQVVRPQYPLTNVSCAVGVFERFGYFSFIVSHRLELKLDSVLPSGLAFGRWTVTGSTRPVMSGPAIGLLTSTLVVLDVSDTVPGSICGPFRLQGTIDPNGDWGPLGANAGTTCGLNDRYYLVDWTGMPSQLP